MEDQEFQKRLGEAFVIEAREHIQAMSQGFLELEAKPPEDRQARIIETVFREAHSLKGAARAVNRSDIESVCQPIESVFSAWKKQAASFSPATFDVLNRAIDLLFRLLGLSDAAQSNTERREIVETIRQLGQLPAPAQQGRPPLVSPGTPPAPPPGSNRSPPRPHRRPSRK